MGFRILGLLAILGGVGVTIGVGIHVGLTLASPAVRPWDVVKDPLEASIMAVAGIGGIVALAVVIAGLAFLFQDRISKRAALAASIGSVGGVLGVLGAFPALFFMPIGSAILAWDLARARVLSRWEAAAHVASAIGFFVSIAAMLNNTQLGVAVVLTLFYPLTWLAIGGSVLRSMPMGPVVREIRRSLLVSREVRQPPGAAWHGARSGASTERKTSPVSLGVPRGWPQRSGGQAPEADALSAELQARSRR